MNQSMNPRFASLVALCLCLAGLSGCNVSQPFPDRATYALDPGKPEKSQTAGSLTLRVMPLRIAPPYDAQLFNYKLGGGGGGRFTQDYYAGFITPPDRMLGAQLLDWLNDSGAVAYATPPGTSLDTVANLESHVTALYADHNANAAILEIRIFLISDPDGLTPSRILFQKHYTEKEPLPAKTPDALVTSLNTAWRRILTNLATDLAKVPDARTPKLPKDSP
jgi:ABC-type uncharacterized transport system auxiliary subunit